MSNKTLKEEPMLDFKEIKRLVQLLEKSQIHEIEIFDKGRKIRLAKAAPSDGHMGGIFMQAPAGPLSLPGAPLPAAGAEAAAGVAVGRNVRQVKSPMVGTFYSAPSPDADPYVQVGDMVHKGQVLCIIEAMKLMNEIESEFNGRIVEVHVENAQPVEFDQLLFTLEAV
jgi:acetyl-CoA carboxylase biotin carboxyl carrier protein